MPAERLCVGCGFSTSEAIGDSHPNQRPALLEAASQLLGFVLLLDEQPCEDDEKMELRRIFRKFRRQKDGDFVSLLLAVFTGRNDLCVSGVFGAGKTRAAAALIDPSLKTSWS